METLPVLVCIEVSHLLWQVHIELCHRNPDTIKKAKQNVKQASVIQLNCEEVHTFTNCEEPGQEELRPPRKNSSLHMNYGVLLQAL